MYSFPSGICSIGEVCEQVSCRTTRRTMAYKGGYAGIPAIPHRKDCLTKVLEMGDREFVMTRKCDGAFGKRLC